MARGYAPKTIPIPFFIVVGLAFFILLMYLTLFLISKKIRGAGSEERTSYGVSLPYYETPPAVQPAPQASRQWWETGVQKEEEFRQDAYETFQRQEFDTDRKMEKIEQDRDFRKMQRSLN